MCYFSTALYSENRSNACLDVLWAKKLLLGIILCKELIARISNASLTLNQENECFVLKRKSKICRFFASKSSGGNFMPGIDCAWKCFSDPDSGKLVHVRFSLQYTPLFSWIGVKESFSRFGNACNRFPA